MGDVRADKDGDVLRAVAISHGRLCRVPESGDGHAGDPGDETVGGSPNRGDDDETDCQAAELAR